MSITVSGLTKIYGEQRSVDNISFEVKSGEVLGFLGPNGAGKSTTMKIITGYVPPSAGTATVCGFNIETQALEAKRNIGYLPENNPLYLDMYVKEFLHFTGRLNHIKNRKIRVKEMLRLTGLEPEQRKKIGALSRGYRQRVGIAQALLHDPKVLIMDEPTSGLDPNQLTEIREMIRELGKEKTVVLSTHIMQEVQAICNRVVIINKGKIVADDTVEGLNKRATGEAVVIVRFKEKVNKEMLSKITDATRVENLVDKWKVYGSMGLQEKIFEFAVKNQLTIVSLTEEKQSLEQVFRELTTEDPAKPPDHF